MSVTINGWDFLWIILGVITGEYVYSFLKAFITAAWKTFRPDNVIHVEVTGFGTGTLHGTVKKNRQVETISHIDEGMFFEHLNAIVDRMRNDR